MTKTVSWESVPIVTPAEHNVLFSWQAPTEREDGSPLRQGDILSYVLVEGDSHEQQLKNHRIPGDQTSVELTVDLRTTSCFCVRAIVRDDPAMPGKAILLSERSEWTPVGLLPSTPPTNLSAIIDD